MNTKKLIILVCVAAALVALAILTTNNGQTGKTNVSSEQIFADLPVNDITRIEITTASDSMRIMKKNEKWVAVDKFSYPVKFDRVKDALISLVDLKAGDKRSLNDKQRERVKMFSPLNEDAPEESMGSLARVYTDKKKPAAELLIGAARSVESSKPGAGADGTFISPDGGKTVLLTSQFVGYLQNADPAAWLNTEVLSVNSFSITNITVALHDEKPYSLFGEEKGDLTMEKIPWRKKLDENKVRSARFALSYLRFAEVADPSLTDEEMGFDKPSTFTAATSKDEVYKVTIGGTVEGSSDRYVRAEAKFLGSIPEAAEGKEGASEKSKEASEAAERVDAVNDRLDGWTYVISGPHVQSMLYSRDKLIVKKDD